MPAQKLKRTNFYEGLIAWGASLSPGTGKGFPALSEASGQALRGHGGPEAENGKFR